MDTLAQLISDLSDLGPNFTISRTGREVAITSQAGMQVIARQEANGKISVIYEETLHVLRRQQCEPGDAAQLIRRLFRRARLGEVS